MLKKTKWKISRNYLLMLALKWKYYRAIIGGSYRDEEDLVVCVLCCPLPFECIKNIAVSYWEVKMSTIKTKKLFNIILKVRIRIIPQTLFSWLLYILIYLVDLYNWRYKISTFLFNITVFCESLEEKWCSWFRLW